MIPPVTTLPCERGDAPPVPSLHVKILSAESMLQMSDFRLFLEKSAVGIPTVFRNTFRNVSEYGAEQAGKACIYRLFCQGSYFLSGVGIRARAELYPFSSTFDF